MELTYEPNSYHVALCHFCEHHGPSVIFHTTILHDTPEDGDLNLHSSNNLCLACNPFGNDHPGFTTYEPNMKKTTVSSRKFTSKMVKNQLQQACLRSLSSEVTPLKEAPIFFNDTGVGINVISHTFFLKDSSARGFQRWFSIIALASSNAALVRSWDILVAEMKDLIRELQQMAAEVYLKEEEQCSHRLLRTNLHITNVGAARSLQDITGTPAVLLKLHTKLSRMALLTNHTLTEVKLRPCEDQFLMQEEAVMVLVQICREVGKNFKPFARHVLTGGLTSISSDDLFFKETCIRAIQYLVPFSATSTFLIPQHTLLSASNPYLIVSPKSRRITCILNICQNLNKASCIVSRLENILLTEDVCPLFIHKQITNLREQLVDAAKIMKELRSLEQRKVLNFFQSLGYDCGDFDILQYWGTHC